MPTNMSVILQNIWARIGLISSLCIGGVVLAEICVQLAYPGDRLPPLLRLDGQIHWFAGEELIESQIARLDNEVVRVATAGRTYSVTIHDLGFRHNAADSMQPLTSYPISQRLIPFSLIVRGWSPVTISRATDQKVLNAFSERVSKEQAAPAIDASIKQTDGVLVLVPGKNGSAYPAERISSEIATAMREGKALVPLSGAAIPPQITDEAVSALIPTAQRQVHTGVTLSLGGVNISPDKSTLASWVRVTRAGTDRHVALEFDDSLIQAYVSSVKGKFGVAAGSSTVTLVDGLEVARTPAATGRTIDIVSTAAAVKKALGAGNPNVPLTGISIPPSAVYVRSYSNSEAGLRALVNYLATSKRAYGISIREISGRGWAASANGDRVFTTASTYKLFVAYSVLKRIESGEFNWADPIAGTDRSTCFDRMIINSDNPCAEAMGRQIGWNTIDAEIHALGLSSRTKLGTTFSSTASDEAIFMEKLARAQLLNEDSRSRLIDRMKHQRFRSGIPAGTGVEVADKVGFLSGLLHDAAIVYAPGKTYVLVIMTDGSSWAQIADTARQIQAQLSR